MTSEMRNITSPLGIRQRLAISRLWPRPTPVSVGASRRIGSDAAVTKKANPTQIEVRFVSSTGRCVVDAPTDQT